MSETKSVEPIPGWSIVLMTVFFTSAVLLDIVRLIVNYTQWNTFGYITDVILFLLAVATMVMLTKARMEVSSD